MTCILGLMDLATMQVLEAPLPPPQWDDDHLHLGQVFDDLQAIGSHPRYQHGFVDGVDVAVALLSRQALYVLPGVVEVLPVEDDLSAHVTYGLHLAWVGPMGHRNDGVDPEDAGGVGDGLAVVAGGGGGDALTPFFLRELGDEVDPPTHLEGAQPLVVLVLYVDLGLQKLAQRGVVVQGGPDYVGGDAPPGLDDVPKGGSLAQSWLSFMHMVSPGQPSWPGGHGLGSRIRHWARMWKPQAMYCKAIARHLHGVPATIALYANGPM